jgi:hypothetical protein
MKKCSQAFPPEVRKNCTDVPRHPAVLIARCNVHDQSMKILILIVILTATAPAFAQDESFTVGAIDFYGRDGLNVNAIRTALPLREGDQASRGAKEIIVERFRKAIKQTTACWRACAN